MSVNLSTMVINSLIANGEKAIGDTLTTNEQTYYLSKMNTMMDSWSIDRSLCYQLLQENFALTAAVGTYTIGSGATFNTTRPTRITTAFVRDSANADSNVDVVPQESYDSVVVKGVSGSYPRWMFYDHAFDASGYAKIFLYPLPKDSLTLYINSWKQLQQFASISSTLLLPPGYQRAIESNFTIECAPGLKSVAPEVLKIAEESLAAIRSLNLPDVISRMEVGLVHRSTGTIIAGP